MTEPNDRNARLLAESFHDDWATGGAAQFACAAAAHARRRRRLRQALATGGGVAAIAIVGFFASHRPGAMPPTIAAAPSLAQPRGYEIISDDQLLAQLRDRSVLVVRKENGSREIVLLASE